MLIVALSVNLLEQFAGSPNRPALNAFRKPEQCVVIGLTGVGRGRVSL
jgi:hypothetical protein